MTDDTNPSPWVAHTAQILQALNIIATIAPMMREALVPTVQEIAKLEGDYLAALVKHLEIEHSFDRDQAMKLAELSGKVGKAMAEAGKAAAGR